MALIVQKYGGTSVGSVERIKNVARRVKAWSDAGHQIVVAVSAMSGETNRLIGLAKEISADPDHRELDVIVSTGEQVTIGLLALALQSQGQAAESFTGWQAGMMTDQAHGKARIGSINTDKLMETLNAGKVAVVAGFQGITDEGRITTLGRGGSDTTAVAIAAALNADECQIYTDVDGVYTTDPRVEPKARKMDTITSEEMLEMASLGAKVLQIRSVEFAGKYKVPLRVLSSLEEIRSFDNPGGTLIIADDKKDSRMEEPLISGVAFNRDEAKITVTGVPDQPGIAFGILDAIAKANIEVDMIVQNTSLAGKTDFTFTVHRNDYIKALDITQKHAKEMGAESVSGDNSIAKVSLVGVGMRSHAGIASSMFQSLAKENINIRMISTSEIKISVVIDEKYTELAVRTLHAAFELDKA
jgi:aspartate kinase